uniref:Adenosine deaminase n=1 Tax=Rhabditophanes sp. KR3021 TaxID=114890 RepID=A0AC35TZ98_9BILA
MISPPPVTPETKKKYNFPLVELHLHLDGAIRFETVWELAQKKNIKIGECKNVEDLKNLLVTHTPADLSGVLAAFDTFLPIVRGDLEAHERIAYELVQDQHENGVVYFEARYAPQFFSDATQYNLPLPEHYGPRKEISCDQIVEAINRGLARGEKEFGVVARSILCCIRGFEKWAPEVLRLVKKYSKDGVVGIDVAGSSGGADEKYSCEVTKVFVEAHAAGIHATAHAGEAGTYKEVKNVVDNMKVTRVGHGYHVLDDEETYKSIALDQRIHLEACPYSSYMTGSFTTYWKQHPIVRWAGDDANFSLSTDDPICFTNSVQSELILANEFIGLSIHQLWKCQLNAMNSCFLGKEDASLRQQLIDKIKAAEPKH